MTDIDNDEFDANDDLGVRGLDPVDLGVHHRRGHFRHLDGEQSAEPAAFVLALEINSFDTSVSDQLLRLVEHTQPSHPVIDAD